MQYRMHTTRSANPLPLWLLALALVLSVGINLYCLTPRYQSLNSPTASQMVQEEDDDEDDTDNDNDRSWAVLTEELRETRQQLAACQTHHPAPDSLSARR